MEASIVEGCYFWLRKTQARNIFGHKKSINVPTIIVSFFFVKVIMIDAAFANCCFFCVRSATGAMNMTT